MTTRLPLTCHICGNELTGGLDTFGDVGDEMCQECWIHLPEIIDGFNLTYLPTKTVWDGEKLILKLEDSIDEEAFS